MTRTELIELQKTMTASARAIMNVKNQDYSGATGGIFANFNACDYLGVSPITGILMRMTDKLSRISSFDTRGELLVQGEGVEDALIDLINYSVLIAGMIQEEKENAVENN